MLIAAILLRKPANGFRLSYWLAHGGLSCNLPSRPCRCVLGHRDDAPQNFLGGRAHGSLPNSLITQKRHHRNNNRRTSQY